MITNLELIQRIPLFSWLPPQQLPWIAENVVKRRYKRGEAIVTQGGMGHDMIVLLSGRARVVQTDERGREVILATLNTGECIGDMSIIDSAPHSATVITEVQSDALVLPRAFMAKALLESAGLTFGMLLRMVKRLRSANEKINSLALLQLYDRVVRELQNLSAIEDGQYILRIRLNRQDLAKTVGASRERVSKVIKNLEERGQLVRLPDGAFLVRQDLAEDRSASPRKGKTAPNGSAEKAENTKKAKKAELSNKSDKAGAQTTRQRRTPTSGPTKA